MPQKIDSARYILYIKKSDLCCLEVWMENGAAESGTGLLRSFETWGDLFNSAILLMVPPRILFYGGSATRTEKGISPYRPTHNSLYGHMDGHCSF